MKELITSEDLKRITNLTFEGVNGFDAPDYCDAYLESGDIGDRELTEEEIDYINIIYDDWVYDKLMDWLN